MTASRPWIATCLALSCAVVASAQSESTGTGASGSSAGSSGAGGGSSAAPSSAFSSSSSTPTTTPGASSTFGGSGTGGGTGSLFDIFSGNRGSDGGGSSAPTAPVESAPSFVLPGLYGQGSETFRGGYGRLSRPEFTISLSFSVGYDDNIFQTPSDNTPQVIPGGSQVIEPGEDAQIIAITRRTTGNGGLGNATQTTFVTIPGTPDTVRTEDLVIPVDERVGSFITQSNLKLEMQRFTRRSLLTLDANVGRMYYWAKDEDPVDYNGGLSANYLLRITPRLQTTATVNAAYLSQPDLSRANTPDRQIRGELLNTLGRWDMTYRFTPRTSLTGSASYAGNRYTEKLEQGGDYDQWTLGIEARYLWKPRWTLLAELRHSAINYSNNPALDADTEILLLGTEFTINPRLGGSFRLGDSVKRFHTSGKTQTAPYLESTVNYRSTARSSIVWTNRFGFEEPSSPDEERLVYRSNIGYTYAFTPRLQGSASINLLHEVSTNDVADTKFAQDTVDANLGLNYQLTKHFSLNGNYSFTIVNSNIGVSDYYRNRIFFGGQVTF